MDRQVLATYREWPSTWPAIAKRATVRDFRSVKEFPPAYGADTRLIAVKEQGGVPEATINEQAAMTYAVKKYGRRIAFSWEAMINDDLEQLRTSRSGSAGRRAGPSRASSTELFVDANGPHASLYTSGNKNIVNTTNGARHDQPAALDRRAPGRLQGPGGMKDERRRADDHRGGHPGRAAGARDHRPQHHERDPDLDHPALAGGAPPTRRPAGEQQLIVDNWMRNKLS
jgi:hypothetical protein